MSVRAIASSAIVVALAGPFSDPPGDVLYAFGAADRGAAVFLND
jgi:hypothetical protein